MAHAGWGNPLAVSGFRSALAPRWVLGLAGRLTLREGVGLSARESATSCARPCSATGVAACSRVESTRFFP